MTEPHDLDELASALLDGTTSPEEDGRLAGDAAFRGRVEARAEELRAVRQALSELPPVDAAKRETAIATALDAFTADGTPETSGASVTPLAPRRGLSPGAVRALSAAAVLLILALLVPLLAGTEGDDETASFDSTGAAIEGSTGAEEAEAPAPSTTIATQDAGSPAGAGSAPMRQLGSYEDVDALAVAVAQGDVTEFDELSDGESDSRTNAGARCVPDPGPFTAVAAAVVAGAPVEVHVTTGSDGARTMVVRALPSCDVIDRREL